MQKYKEIERSIIKKYRKEIWRRFVKAVQEYKLINENDNIKMIGFNTIETNDIVSVIINFKKHNE